MSVSPRLSVTPNRESSMQMADTNRLSRRGTMLSVDRNNLRCHLSTIRSVSLKFELSKRHGGCLEITVDSSFEVQVSEETRLYVSISTPARMRQAHDVKW